MGKMTMRSVRNVAVAAAVLALAGAPVAANAQAWKQARAAGTIGEQTDGYLAVVGGNAAQQATVDDINIQRKAAYTAQAQAERTTVEAAGISGGCAQIRNLSAGMKYRAPGGAWQTVGAGPLQLDSRCPQ